MSKNQSYDEFVDKFKPNLTTDDCYTPPNIYEAVKQYAMRTCGISPDTPIIRPFFPGGDYEHADYPEGCVVIDNPPFSILARIVRFYIEHDIKFYLFAPSLTLFHYCNFTSVTAVCACADIIYENGALVKTSFISNIYPGNPIAIIDGHLYKMIDSLNKEHRENKQKRSIKLPNNVINAALMGKICVRGIYMQIPREEAVSIARLDCGYKIFGNGLLLSDRLAAERLAAERLAAERLAAERLAAKRLAEREVYTYELSDREKRIIKNMAHEQPQ